MASHGYRTPSLTSKETGHSEELGLDGRIILKWIHNLGGKLSAGLFWLRMGPGAASCNYGNENLGSIKRLEFLA
jgi:hypothetical protein